MPTALQQLYPLNISIKHSRVVNSSQTESWRYMYAMDIQSHTICNLLWPHAAMWRT